MQDKKSERFLSYNLFWNKHFLDLSYNEELALRMKKILQSFLFIRYSIFTVERGQNQGNAWHFQGYIEFSKRIDVKAFDKNLARVWEEKSQTFFSDKQNRKGSQQQAIDYVLKQGIYSDRKEEQIDGPYQFGNQKKKITLFNYSDSEIKELKGDLRKLKILVNRRLKDNFYKEFKDLEEDFEYFFINDKKWLLDLWDRYHPILKNNVPMLMVYWIYGKPGSGKSTFANDLIYNRLGYNEDEVSLLKFKKKDIWYDKEDRFSKVLHIEEVDRFLPDREKLIEVIDRKSRLPVKGSKVRNDFEVLVITSPNSPEDNYSWIKEEDALREILRRIYQRHSKKSLCITKVYHLLPSKDPKEFNKIVEVSADREKLPLSIKRYWQQYFNDQFQTMQNEIREISLKIDDLKESLTPEKKDYPSEKQSFFTRLKNLFNC